MNINKILNAIGLSLAFAAFYIIMVQVNYGLNYNKSVKDADQIYAVAIASVFGDGYGTHICVPPLETIIKECPGIEAGGFYQSDNDFVFFDTKGAEKNPSSTKIWEQSAIVSEGTIKTFDYQTINGSWADMLEPKNIAISESLSKNYGFNLGDIVYSEDYLGKESEYIVTVIFKDMPNNSDFTDNIIFIDQNFDKDWSEWSFPYYFRLSKDADINAITQNASTLFKKLMVGRYYNTEITDEDFPEYADILSKFDIQLVNISDLYFDELIVEKYTESGKKSTTMVLSIIAMLILAIALINFINFFMALVPSKVHGVNTRKVLGASRSELIWGFVRESLVIALVALVLSAGIILIFGSSPFSHLISYSTAFADNIGLCVFTVVIALVAVAAASLSPAFYITSFSPALVLKGSFATSSRGKVFRNLLVAVQFVISISMIICTSFIAAQRRFMEMHDMGFNRENLLVVRTRFNANKTVEDKLLQNPNIKELSWANGDFVKDTRMGWGRDFNGGQINFSCYPVSWNFLRFMGIEIIEGRDFSESDMECENGVFIFNESAKKEFGLSLEDKLSGHRGLTDIAGFCRDFNFRALREGVAPFSLYVYGKSQWGILNTLFVRTIENSDLNSVFTSIRETVSELDPFFTPEDVDVQFFDQKLQSQYTQEKNLSTLIALFTFLAILISLIGVFGLVLFETEHKRKEIAIRRVNGASIKSILVLFNMMFVRIVLICFVIATPISYFIIKNYLNGFAYKVTIHWYIFALVLFVTLLITIAVVTSRSYRAATLNPSETLNKE